MASTNSTATAKTHVSLRLPTYLLESIDAHAERESISRTEAFVFYLQTGLDIADIKADEPSKDKSMLMGIQEDLAEIKALLQQGAGQAVPAQAIAEAVTPVVEATSAFTSEAAAESKAYAEQNFMVSDAVSEETAADEPEAELEEEPEEASSEEPSESAYGIENRAEAEAEAEEDYTTSDAVSEEMFSAPETASEEAFTLHETDDEPESDDEDETFGKNIDEGEDDEASDEEDAVEESYDFDTSDAVDYEKIEDEVDPCDEALSYKKLEKAVAKASKQIDFIEKVWLFGLAADEEEITAPVLDLCVKTEDDKKLKSKHLDRYIAAIEEKTGKIVNVVLRHEIKDKSEIQNRVELYKN